jgi:hypothetical protein
MKAFVSIPKFVVCVCVCEREREREREKRDLPKVG